MYKQRKEEEKRGKGEETERKQSRTSPEAEGSW
jgi:hypothetical protein